MAGHVSDGLGNEMSVKTHGLNIVSLLHGSTLNARELINNFTDNVFSLNSTVFTMIIGCLEWWYKFTFVILTTNKYSTYTFLYNQFVNFIKTISAFEKTLYMGRN